MKLKILLSLLFMLVITNLQAAQLRTPPPLLSESVEEQKYFREIWENHNNLVTVTSNPNGSVEGQKGDVLFFDTTTDKICVNVDGATAWRCADLTVP